jgi:hypothetical protein
MIRNSNGGALHQRSWPSRRLPICAICNEWVELENSKTDEDGQAIHEECYLQKLHNEAVTDDHIKSSKRM